MYIHKNHLIKSPGLYTIYVKNRRKKKNSLVFPFYKWERKIFGYFNFRLRLCLFEHGKKKEKKLSSLPGQDCYLCFETIWSFEPVLAQKEFLN